MGSTTPTTAGRVGVDPAGLSRDAAVASAWSADELVHDVITARAAEQAGHCARTYAPRIGEVTCPVLVVHGDADPIAPVDGSRRLEGQGPEVVVVPGARHDLLHETGFTRVDRRVVVARKDAKPRKRRMAI